MISPDQDAVQRTLALLFQPGDTIELRCVGNRTIGGYYNNHAKLVQDACSLNADFEPKENAYVCLNPVDPKLHGLRADQFAHVRRGECVKDADAVCRRWLLIDLDPVRPAGVSATNEQKQAAHDRSQRVRRYLVEELNLPESVYACFPRVAILISA